MNFQNQQEALTELKRLAEQDRHSILIEGPAGCGKTYVAKQFAAMLGVADVAAVNPNVNDIRSMMNECASLTNPIVVIIENLDTGLNAASYTILKFLEEPSSNIYIVVTCRNIQRVPDTIISRSVVVTIAPPIDSDILQYTQSRYPDKYNSITSQLVWKAVRSFQAADLVAGLNAEQLTYYNTTIPEIAKFKDTVSTIIWTLGHYADNSATPVEFVISMLMVCSSNPYIRRACMNCIKELNMSRIAQHATLAQLVLDCKYGG